ncbi:hypothetical protein BC834DRAFT_133555 [Gloeopeniophorella convolvens]|nr:hypothetical protein BC834DRAFT_133555 [Gloeopeniophorella convolvens]
MDTLQPPNNNDRRRSVDVGGLKLALNTPGSGHGWGGWLRSPADAEQQQPVYAELLSDMYTHTQTVINAHERSDPIVVSSERRAQLIQSLDSWHFEPHKLPEDEVLYCSLIIFETLFRLDGLSTAVPVSPDQVMSLIANLQHVYRQQNSYHNFEHALDVLQAIHRFLCSAGRVPPASVLLESDDRTWKPSPVTGKPALVHYLTDEDLFCLYVASIGHDAGHPGVTNGFMKNAQAPLSSLYDHNSPLEQLHYTLLSHILRRQGFAFLLDNSGQASHFRELLAKTILATDMRVHYEFMDNYRKLVEGAAVEPWDAKVLVCQALIKAADISNPCRPLNVSQHWASALQEEWTTQATLERHLHMNPSVKEEDDPLSEAKSQVWFIETFAKPLFDLTACGIPETAEYADQCSENLTRWKTRVQDLSSLNGAESDTLSRSSSERERPFSPTQSPEDFASAFPMALPASLRFNVDQSDRSSILSIPPPALTDTDSSRASSPTLAAATSGNPPLPPLSITRGDAGSSNSSSPSLNSAPQSPGLSDTASTRANLLSPSHDGTLGLVVSMGANGTGSSAAAIRAAYKVSVRKKPSFHRNSWSPGLHGIPVPPLPTSTVPARREMSVIAGQGIEP